MDDARERMQAIGGGAARKSKDDSKTKTPIPPGGLMKAVVRPGAGDCPKSDDQVIFHCTTRTSEGVIVDSTKTELGGSGEPIKLVLGKSKMIRGWEEGLTTILKGEIAMLKILPEFHYEDPECPVAARSNFPKGDVLIFEIEMLEVRPVKIVTEDFGVLKQVIREGHGFETPREPYDVKIWLTGRVGGDVFFTQTEGDPFVLTLGKGQVPEGLEKGISTMTRSEKAIFFVSDRYVSAVSAMPDMPSKAKEVEFEVEVVQIVQVRDMLGDGRLVKRRLRDGEGEFPMGCPLQDSILRIHYKGFLSDGTKFFDTRTANEGGEPLVFASGEGQVPEGLEMCVKLMLPGELALVHSTSELAYDKFTKPEGVSDKANVQWEVELVSFEPIKDWTGLNFKEIMADATKTRTIGNRLFKEGKVELAKAKYEKILREFKHVNTQDDEEGREFSQARALLELNVAACEHKLGDFVKCIELSDKVLEMNPCHAKALYRRGTAYMARGDFQEARADFQKMMDTDKSSEEDARAALARLKKKEQEANAKARKQFQGLFDKRPGEISNECQDPQEEAKEHEQVVLPRVENAGAAAGAAGADADADAEQDEQDDHSGDGATGLSNYRQRLARLWNASSAVFRSKKCAIL